MAMIPFSELPDHGRLWVFPLSRDLEDAEAEACLEVVDRFLDGWAAHGAPLRSARRLVERRFLLVGVDVDAEAPSGCSIDALVGQLRALGQEIGARFIDHAPVWFRSEEGVRSVTRADFKRLVKDGLVTTETPVFDTSIVRVEDVRSGRLERPASETWHGRAFFAEQVGA